MEGGTGLYLQYFNRHRFFSIFQVLLLPLHKKKLSKFKKKGNEQYFDSKRTELGNTAIENKVDSMLLCLKKTECGIIDRP